MKYTTLIFIFFSGIALAAPSDTIPGSPYLLPEAATNVSFSPNQSTLFYISIGSTFMKKKPRPLTMDEV